MAKISLRVLRELKILRLELIHTSRPEKDLEFGGQV